MCPMRAVGAEYRHEGLRRLIQPTVH
jgi:hypothetical protein